MRSPRNSVLTRTLLALALLAPVGLAGHAAASSAAGTTAAAPSVRSAAAATPEDVAHRRSEMDLDLISRTYNAGDDNWTLVAEATVTSNRICLPVVFNCIVAEVSSPSNATLSNLSCDSPGWNHLLVFRNHCLKQLLFAGHDQKFTFTWNTDPGVSSGTVNLEVEFGRGFLPATFQQLAKAGLTVDLGVSLEINKTCPTEVAAGGTLNCSVVLDYPATPGGGPAINGIPVTDTPDGDLAALLSASTLTFDDGDGTWDCAALECTDGELSNGQSATFKFSATVANDPTGGTGVNAVSVSTPGGDITSDDSVTVVGNGDTSLEIEKSTTDTEASPGGPITWTVKVTNAGPLAATDVLVSDIPPAEVEGLTLTYVDGVGDWTCSGLSCSSASMPLGSATFTAKGTVSADTKGDTSLVNEVGVTWANDILGPDFPITAGSAVPVVAGATTTTTPETPSTSTPGSNGVPLTIAG